MDSIDDLVISCISNKYLLSPDESKGKKVAVIGEDHRQATNRGPTIKVCRRYC